MGIKSVPLINMGATLADMRCERERLFWEREERSEDTVEQPLTSGLVRNIMDECDSDLPIPSIKLIDSFVTQRAFRESEIHLALQMLQQIDPEDTEARENIEDLVFPRNFQFCDKDGENECPYFDRCFERAK